MKAKTYILSIINLLFLADPTVAQQEQEDCTKVTSGVYIHGEVGVLAGGEVGVFGDLFLDSAKIKGSGTLIMHSSEPHTLVADHSSLANLRIENATTITLKGQLLVSNSLIVDKGVFDTHKATLQFTDTTHIGLQHDGQLLKTLPSSNGGFTKSTHRLYLPDNLVFIADANDYSIRQTNDCVITTRAINNESYMNNYIQQAIEHPPEITN